MRLERHAWRLGSRIDALKDSIGEHDTGCLNPAEAFKVERAIIQLQIEWEHFVRAVILDSAIGRYSTRSGIVSSTLPLKVKSREHAGQILIEQYKRRKTEPDWYLPQEAIQAANKLALTNENQIATELGVTPWELEDLRHLRNFIAHRSTRSAVSVRAVCSTMKGGRIVPSSLCYEYGPGGIRRYEGWAFFMKGVASRLVA